MKEKDNRAQFSTPVGLENQNEQGTVKLHESVIATVVKNTTCSINGVIRLAGGSLSDSIAGLLGGSTRKKGTDGAVKIELSDDGAAVVEVNVITAYGENIPDLALQIQTTIIDEVKKITGVDVSQINVCVQGIEEIVEEEIVEEEKKEPQTTE